MAIIKFTNSKNSLKGILNYITQAEKTEAKLVSGKDCIAESAFQEMQTIKRMYGKDSGRQYIHVVQSFAPYEPLTHEKAHEIGCKLAECFKGFQAVIATHKDRNHIHNHIVLNSVNMETGLKFQQSKKQMQEFKDFSDRLCLEYGLSIIMENSHSKDISQNEYKVAEKGDSWKFKLMNAIDTAMADSPNKQEFISKMNALGYQVKWQQHHKYITYTTPEGKKCRDNRLHDDKYLKKNMEEFYEHRQTQRTKQTRTNDRELQRQSTSLRYTARNTNGYSDTTSRGRKNASIDSEGNQSLASMERFGAVAHSRTEKHGQETREDFRIHQRDDRNFFGGTEFRLAGMDEREYRSTYGNTSGERFVPNTTTNEVGFDGHGFTSTLLGAAMAIDSLLNQPEKEEKQKDQTMVKKRRKKKHKKNHINDHDSELEL